MTSSPQSQNLLLAALPADDFELLRPNLQLIDLARGMVLISPEMYPRELTSRSVALLLLVSH